MDKSALGEALLEHDQQKTEAEKKDSWEKQIYTLKDAYAERPQQQYIVQGLFTLPSLSIAYGPPGSLKSMLMTDCAISIAAGLPWIDRTVIQAPSLSLDMDNGTRRSHERNEATARSRGLSENIPFFYLTMPRPFFNAGSLRDVMMLTKIINERGIKAVFIDNLGLVKGNADENSADMITVMGNLRYLAEQTGAAIVLLHHQRKSAGTGGRSGDTLRGHSSIEAAIDLGLLIEREDHSGIVSIRSTKTRDVEVLPFGCEFNFTHKPCSNELSEAWFSHVQVEDAISDRAIERVLLETVSEHPLLNQQQLIKETKPALQAGVNRIRSMIERLEKSGRIIVNEGKRGARLYSLE